MIVTQHGRTYRNSLSANAGEGVTDHVRPWHARNLCGICHRVGPRQVKQSRLSSKMEDRLISGRLANAFLCLRSSPAPPHYLIEERAVVLPRVADHLQPLITGPDTRPPMENPPFETTVLLSHLIGRRIFFFLGLDRGKEKFERLWVISFYNSSWIV